MPMMKREDYKAIKHMDKQELTDYLTRLYKRGYWDGVQAMATEVKNASAAAKPNLGTPETHP